MRYNLLMTTSFIFLISCQLESYQKNELRPNIIFILADDLGYGNLSCYGQTHFKTKNIDKLAKNGITFTQHYSGRTMAPSRAGLMTGMHAHTETTIGNKRDKFGNWTLPSKNITIAEILKDNGYTTGVFGKWGLGYPGSDGDPNKQGFDEYFGYNDQTLAHSYYPLFLHHNQDTVWLEGNKGAGKEIYAPTLIHEQALKFIENNKNNTFFMYYPTIIPHAELCAPEIYMKKYRGKFLPEKEFQGADEGHPLFKKGGIRITT
jgi:arylsulfatase A-like enzyme